MGPQLEVCGKKRGGCGAIFDSSPTVGSSKGFQPKRRRTTACPRCNRERYIFSTASGPIMCCRGGDLAGTPCTLIRECQGRAVIPGGSRRTGHTRGGGSATCSGAHTVAQVPEHSRAQGGGEPSPPLSEPNPQWRARTLLNTQRIMTDNKSTIIEVIVFWSEDEDRPTNPSKKKLDRCRTRTIRFVFLRCLKEDDKMAST